MSLTYCWVIIEHLFWAVLYAGKALGALSALLSRSSQLSEGGRYGSHCHTG